MRLYGKGVFDEKEQNSPTSLEFVSIIKMQSLFQVSAPGFVKPIQVTGFSSERAKAERFGGET